MGICHPLSIENPPSVSLQSSLPSRTMVARLVRPDCAPQSGDKISAATGMRQGKGIKKKLTPRSSATDRPNAKPLTARAKTRTSLVAWMQSETTHHAPSANPLACWATPRLGLSKKTLRRYGSFNPDYHNESGLCRGPAKAHTPMDAQSGASQTPHADSAPCVLLCHTHTHTHTKPTALTLVSSHRVLHIHLTLVPALWRAQTGR